MKRIIFTLALLLGPAAQAHETLGNHGGIVADAGPYHVELVAKGQTVEVYVTEHNAKPPHSALDGQTPDEMFFGTGAHVPATRALARKSARFARLEANRALQCAVCA